MADRMWLTIFGVQVSRAWVQHPFFQYALGLLSWLWGQIIPELVKLRHSLRQVIQRWWQHQTFYRLLSVVLALQNMQSQLCISKVKFMDLSSVKFKLRTQLLSQPRLYSQFSRLLHQSQFCMRVSDGWEKQVHKQLDYMAHVCKDVIHKVEDVRFWVWWSAATSRWDGLTALVSS